MLKKTVTYTDFDNIQRTEDLHFHLTKAELIEFVSQYPDDFTEYVNRISKSETKSEIIELFRNLVSSSYGLRQGSKFIKSKELSEEFSHTEAYSQLFFDLFGDTTKMITFFNGVLGVDLDKIVAEAKNQN